MKERFPGRRFSFARLAIALGIAAVLLAVSVVGIRGWLRELQQPAAQPWFAGYADVTATPSYAFEAQTGEAHRNTALSFIVAQEASCLPSWGGYYSLDEAQTSLDLDRRIARLDQLGHRAVLSFGGRDGTDLAQACVTSDALAQAYGEVLDRYQTTTIDLDIEGDDLADEAARARRVAAILALSAQAAAEGRALEVWLTLPAAADGLTAEGLQVVREFLQAQVPIAGVNLMTMNFGADSTERSAGELAIESIRSGGRQLLTLYVEQGTALIGQQLWRMLGATVMIGQSDLAGEVFTLDDARQLNDFALSTGLGRVSMWSLNRDASCGSNYADWSVTADFCSGVDQSDGEFALTLASGFTGSAGERTGATGSGTAAPTVPASDDPATAPYPIWSRQNAYPAQTRVVWRGNVYLAKWWNQDAQPDAPADAGTSPWQLLGPVLPGETPVPEPTLPAGYYPQWQREGTYSRGDRVLHDGIPYEAKWWTSGDSPDASLVDPSSSPWQQLTASQITELLDGG